MCGSKENLLGNYNSIQVAKIECNKDNHCIGIQENIGIFQPCRNGLKKPGKDLSYIHEKQLVTGMSFMVFFLFKFSLKINQSIQDDYLSQLFLVRILQIRKK